MKYFIILSVLIVSTIIISSVFYAINHSYYAKELVRKQNLLLASNKIAVSGSVDIDSSFLWFILGIDDDRKITVKKTNNKPETSRSVETLLRQESERIIKRAGTGGGFIYLRFRHADNDGSKDTLAYTEIMQDSDNIILVLNRDI